MPTIQSRRDNFQLIAKTCDGIRALRALIRDRDPLHPRVRAANRALKSMARLCRKNIAELKCCEPDGTVTYAAILEQLQLTQLLLDEIEGEHRQPS